MENSIRLGRQARPGFELGTSRLPVLSITTLPLVRQHDILSQMGGGETNPQYLSPVLHFQLLSLCFIHKNEQILFSYEIILTHQGKGKLLNEFN